LEIREIGLRHKGRITKTSSIPGKKSFKVIEQSIAQHSKMCIENSDDVYEARELVKLLQDEIEYRIKQYCYCIMNSTDNYKDWLFDEYNRKLRISFNGKF
jgi:hypothetical protein